MDKPETKANEEWTSQRQRKMRMDKPETKANEWTIRDKGK